ncbi:MAG: MFS transporter [Planctomycetota bacterium]
MSEAPTEPPPPAENPREPPLAPSSTRVAGELPPLMSDRAFWGMNVTQFLGAFNDNVFKQLILLLATPTADQLKAAEAAGETAADYQWIATIVFGVPFLMFSGFAGWLAERTSKRSLIIVSKGAEIGVMLLGMVGFYFYGAIGLGGMFIVLFLMGMQSTFFGPPKYGILPEMLRDRDLPRANGIFLMFTFVAIIFGVALAGQLMSFGQQAVENGEQANAAARVWKASAVCVLIAVVGTLTALLVRRVPVADPGAKLTWSDLLVPPQMIRLVWGDRRLLFALIVTSSFWMLGSIVQQAVNALGKSQLGQNDFYTSLLAAMLGLGIPVGCVVGGYLSQGRINPRPVAWGSWGIVVCLVLLSLPGGPNNHLLGYWGTAPVLVLLGFATGMFVVPIQVSLQVLPPPSEKGRMIALMNQCNFVGIILGGFVFGAALSALAAAGLPRNMTFLVTAAIMLPIALFYRPQEMRLGA